jgi:hypothetical protein
VLARKELSHCVVVTALTVEHESLVEWVARHIGDSVLGEAAARSGAETCVVDPVCDLLIRVVAGCIALEHLLDGLCLLRHNHRSHVSVPRMLVAIGRDRRVVEPLASALALGLGSVLAQEIDIVLV